MKVTILGSTRPIGAEAARLALSRGHTVTLLTRSGDSEFKSEPNVTVIKGDATNEEDLRKATEGTDGVLSFLGAGNNRSPDVLPNARFGQAAAKVLPAGTPVITVSNIGASDASFAVQNFFFRNIFVPLFIKPMLTDKTGLENALRASSLKWVALRAAILSDGSSTSPDRIRIIEDETNPDASATSSTKRRDIAYVALDILEGKRTGLYGKAVAVLST
ncbi:hypothetical protein HDV00_006726 [Rhizophlyctis rosea]|nr:hypothetical protein HDV00_006726 [Rhizophlyctis rosea]